MKWGALALTNLGRFGFDGTAEDRFNLQLALKLMPLLDSSALILNPDCEVSYCAF